MAKYETTQDKKRQERASRLFCHAFDLVCVDRGEFAPVDYDLINKRNETNTNNVNSAHWDSATPCTEHCRKLKFKGINAQIFLHEVIK